MKTILKMKNNSKGFTLIELLAVIVILGILMITAIPAVTKYINNSKKDTFADSASAYINSARYSLLNDEYTDCALPAEDNQCVYMTIDNIDIDKGTGKSSYGKDYVSTSYVKVTYDGKGLKYEIDLLDSNGNGTTALTSEKDLGRDKIKAKSASRTITPPTTLCTKCTK